MMEAAIGYFTRLGKETELHHGSFNYPNCQGEEIDNPESNKHIIDELGNILFIRGIYLGKKPCHENGIRQYKYGCCPDVFIGKEIDEPKRNVQNKLISVKIYHLYDGHVFTQCSFLKEHI